MSQDHNNHHYRYLVTGGAGFIGVNLIQRLLDDGHEVLCMDSFLSGSRRSVVKFLDNPLFEIIRHDITLPFTVECDRIFHLACPASPVHYQHNAIKTLKTNVLGTLNVLGLARRINARVLLSSTSEVYGNPEVDPQKEEYFGNVNPVGIRSCYDEGKRAAETLCMDYHRQHGIDVCIARIFNTYGPNMMAVDGRVVSNFIVQALKGESLTVYGDGSQTRSFCYITDLIDGLMALMNSKETGPINIGNPHEFTIKQLADKVIAEFSDKQLKVVYKRLPLDDPVRRRPDITKAKSLLNWEPKICLDIGLKRTIDDFKQRWQNPLYSESHIMEETLKSYDQNHTTTTTTTNELIA